MTGRGTKQIPHYARNDNRKGASLTVPLFPLRNNDECLTHVLLSNSTLSGKLIRTLIAYDAPALPATIAPRPFDGRDRVCASSPWSFPL